jgi:hypothetical protein
MAENRTYSNAKARKLLGFEPEYSLEKAIRQTVRYNLEKGHLARHYLSPVMLYTSVALLLFSVVWYLLGLVDPHTSP